MIRPAWSTRDDLPCRRLATVLLLCFLAGCGGQPARSPDVAVQPGEAARLPGKIVRKPAVVQKRAGAYYKDDGPADEIPDNLDDIPDALPRSEPLHRFANRPYVVLGKAYEPQNSLRPYRQRGVASWYGKKFHGLKTSIGEPYDMFAMTAAHPTLAIPSYVRVTHVGNGKSVVLRVTDRGPFHADRIIDLSYAAAYRLGYVDNGSALVEVEAIVPADAAALALSSAPASPPTSVPAKVALADGRDEIELLAARLERQTAAAPTAGQGPRLPAPGPNAAWPASAVRGIFLQLGAFASLDNAESLRAHLARELDWLSEEIGVNPGGGIHRVHLGPYASRADAERVAERIRLALGYKPTIISR